MPPPFWVLHAERREGIEDGIDDSRRGADGADFADALGTERIVCAHGRVRAGRSGIVVLN